MRIHNLIGTAVTTLMMASAVHADVSWEHEATVRWSMAPQPVMKAKIYNNWTPQRHRVLLKYSVPNDPFAPQYNLTGSAAVIHRLDDDRLIAYSSKQKAFFSEARSPLLEKTRVNLWQGWEPELAGQTPPSLTPEQRARLGAELRAAYRPFTTETFKTYFRTLPNTRVLNDLVATGHRMTWLVNMGADFYGQPSWTRVAFEWWIAPPETSDREVANFYHEAIAPLRQAGGPTSSMWINETLPVLWAAMPVELQQAAATFRAPEGSEAAFHGVPLRMYMTVQPPQDGISVGEMRAEVALINRHTLPLAASVWEAPAGYRRVGGDSFDQQMEDTFDSPMMQQTMRQMIIVGANTARLSP